MNLFWHWYAETMVLFLNNEIIKKWKQIETKTPGPKTITQLSSLMAPELSCVVASGQSPKETWDNLAKVEVHSIVCNRANKVQSSCLILDIWPRSRAGILLLSHHLSSPLCNLWTVTGGFPAAALISVCLSFSISYPASPRLEGRDAEWKTRPARNNRLSVAG